MVSWLCGRNNHFQVPWPQCSLGDMHSSQLQSSHLFPQLIRLLCVISLMWLTVENTLKITYWTFQFPIVLQPLSVHYFGFLQLQLFWVHPNQPFAAAGSCFLWKKVEKSSFLQTNTEIRQAGDHRRAVSVETATGVGGDTWITHNIKADFRCH